MPARRVLNHVALVRDAAGYDQMLGRGHLYFAAKSRRMCAKPIADGLAKGTRMIDETDL
ncbi:hypothetical protein KSP39_PZI002885 [Platanthera zijinensis]|uniref:Uncharacterized protein n=1 Tax=Platanthera zijinensis TaxID=2320716 RepID=A0AAP0BZ61_9ASPA